MPLARRLRRAARRWDWPRPPPPRRGGRQADTPTRNTQAALAQAIVGAELGENIEKLAAALLPADGSDENKIAAAARADTQGREKAIAILTALMGQVPDQAKFGIARAIAALSQDRDDETQATGKALVSKHVSSANKRRVAEAVKTSVDGQATASATLAALIANPNMPAQSKPGLQIAYNAVTGEHGSVADILSRLSPRMPAFVRTFVERIITQARADAQGMRENHPTGPPAAFPAARPPVSPAARPPVPAAAPAPRSPPARSPAAQFGPPSA